MKIVKWIVRGIFIVVAAPFALIVFASVWTVYGIAYVVLTVMDWAFDTQKRRATVNGDDVKEFLHDLIPHS